jgi:hypothetical protein
MRSVRAASGYVEIEMMSLQPDFSAADKHDVKQWEKRYEQRRATRIRSFALAGDRGGLRCGSMQRTTDRVR